MRHPRSAAVACCASLGMLLMLSACAPVQMVSYYDEGIDSGAQQLQKKLDAHFIALLTAEAEDLTYKHQQKFYQGALADMTALEVRAAGIYKNQPTLEQIGLLKDNLAYVVLLHKGCITAPLSEGQKQQVRANGIDLSLDCRVEHGATADADARGDNRLNRALIPPIQALFNQHLGAVMALELAKKRGEIQSAQE